MEIRSNDGNTIIDSNDDAVGTDSRLETELPLSGNFNVVVSGVGSSVGRYELALTVKPGSAQQGGVDCTNEQAHQIVVSPPGAGIVGIGGTTVITADPQDPAGGSLPRTVTWTSLNPNVATVDASGTVTAVSNGQVTIQAQADTAVGYALVTVVVPGTTPVNLVAPDPQFAANVTGPVDTTQRAFLGLYGFAPNDIYATRGNGDVEHFDGSTWTTQTTPAAALFGAWGAATDDVWASGSGGMIVHYDGATWTESSPTSEDLIDVWGSAPNDVYAVGAAGTILHHDGTSWSSMASGTTVLLLGAWGTSSSDVFVVGDESTILHYDGSTWADMANPIADSVFFRDVWGTGPSDVYASGAYGTMVHYDGSSWTEMVTNTGRYQRAVWGTSSSDVIAVGPGPLMNLYDGTNWDPVIPGPCCGYVRTLRTLWGMLPDDKVFIGGSVGTLLRAYRGGTVEATPASITFGSAGETAQLVPTARDAGGTALADVFFYYESSDTLIATVDAAGLVTSVAEGNATITVFASGGASTTVFTVLPAPADPRTPFTVEVEAQTAGGNVAVGFNGPITIAPQASPGNMLFHASGWFDRILEKVDHATPALLPVLPNNQAANITAVAYDETSGFIYAADVNDDLSTIDPTTGIQTVVGNMGILMKGLAVDANGVMWGVAHSSNDAYTIDKGTAVPTPLGPVNGISSQGFRGAALDPTSGTIYVASIPSPFVGSFDLVSVDTATGNGTVIAPLSEAGVASLAFLSDGTLLAATGDGATNPERLWTVDKTSGVMAIRSGLGRGDDGEAIAAMPATVSGTFTVNAVNGVATFSDIQIDAPASGYTMSASATAGGGPISGTSAPFDVTTGTYAPWPADLAFLSVPSGAVARTPFSVDVGVVDVFGTVVDTATGSVTMDLDWNPGTMIFRAHNDAPEQFFYVDPISPTVLPPLPGVGPARSPTALVYDPLAERILISTWATDLQSIDPLTGDTTFIGPLPSRMKGLAWVGGVLWGASGTANEIYTIDPNTAVATLLGPVTGATVNNFNGLAVDPTDGRLYAVTSPVLRNQRRELITIDPATLVGTAIGTLSELGVAGLAFHFDGTLYAGTGVGGFPALPFPAALFEVDKTTAQMALITGMGIQDRCCGASGDAITSIPARLSGTLTAPLSAGVATFANLEIDAPELGYTLVAFPSNPSIVEAYADVDIGPGTPSHIPVAIGVTPGSMTLGGRGDTFTYTAEVLGMMGGVLTPVPGETIGGWFTSNSQGATVDPAGLVTAHAGGDFLVTAADTSGWLQGAADLSIGNRVMLMSNSSLENGLLLDSFGLFMPDIQFDTMDVGIVPPTLASLASYSAVLLWEDGTFANAPLVGDTLAAYVAAGGNVLMGTFYWQDRSDNTIYSPNGWGALETIDPLLGPTGSEYNADALNPASIVAHPITTGVTALSVPSFHGGVTAKAGTSVVASWGDGVPLAAYRFAAPSQRLVAISTMPAYPRFGGYTGDFYLLWQNALNWAGRR